MRDKSSNRLPDVDALLGYWLRRVSNCVSDALIRALESRQISIAEWVALRQLYDHENITSGRLAALLGMTPGAITKVLNKLESKGLVLRTIRTEDKRSQTLALTLAGRHVLPQLAELAVKIDAKYFGCLNAEERMQLKGLLQKLAREHMGKETPIG